MRRLLFLVPAACVATAALAAPLTLHRPYRITPAWEKRGPAISWFDSLDARGRHAAAWAYLDSLVAAARVSGDRNMLLEALVKRGGTRAFRGQGGEADLIEAERLAVAARDTLGQLAALMWRGYGLGGEGRLDRARPLYQRMLVLARAWRSASFEGWARTGLAFGDLRRGRLAAARAGYGAALLRFRAAGDEVGVQQATIGLARVLTQQGRFEEQAALYRAQLGDARRHGDGLAAFQVLNNLGVCEFSGGDPAMAERDWRAAIALADSLGSAGPGREGAEMNLSLALSRLGRYDDAAELLEDVIARARARGGREDMAQASGELSVVRWSQGRHDEAIRIARDALAAVGDTLAADARLYLRLTLAGELQQSGHAAEAGRTYDALEAAPELRGSAGDWADVSGGRAELLLADGRAAQALRALDDDRARMRAAGLGTDEFPGPLRTRARVLLALDRPDSALAAIRAAAALTERQRRLSDAYTWREALSLEAGSLTGVLARALLAAPSLGPPQARARALFDALQPSQARTLAERLRAPGRPDTAAAAPAITLAALQSRVLRGGELLLDLHAFDDSTYLFAVTRRDFRMRVLPGLDELRARADRLDDVLLGDDRATAAIVLHDATAALLGDLAGMVAASTRVIACGGYGVLPLAALPVGGGPLVAGRELAYAPSATLLATLRARPAAGAPRAVLALAGGAAPGAPPLAGATREVRWLAGAFAGVDTRVPGARDAAAAARAFPRYGVLHLAGHATLDRDNPWASGLLLGDGPDPRAWLRAATIAGMRLPARLCVLSGCRSAGVPHAAESVIGLSTAFLVAGVPSTVATLWPVDDQVTATFMQAFYRRLAGGATTAAALRGAQNELRDRAATSAARNWAGFVLVGEPSTRVTLHRAAVSLALP